MSQNRMPMIDSARGIAMILILMGHMIEVFFNQHLRHDGVINPYAYEGWRFIYSFHIPVFYFISGMAAMTLDKRPFDYVLKSSLALIFFACATHIMATPLVLAFHLQGAENSVNLLKYLIRPLVVLSGFSLVVTWFLVSLACVRLMAWKYIRSGFAMKALIILAAAIASLVMLRTNKTYFELQSLAFGLIFFLSGFFFTKHFSGFISVAPKMVQRLGQGVLVILGCVCICALYPLNKGCLIDPFSACNFLNRPGFAVLMIDGYVGFLPLFFLTAFAGIGVVLCAAKALTGTACERALGFVGRNTIELLAINGFFYILAEPLLAHALNGDSSYWKYWTFLFVIIQLAAMPLLGPIFTRIYAACDLLAGFAAEKGRFFLQKSRRPF